ncbi:MAG: hypothetical protein PHF46_04790 [Candidatus Gracilibacteria bacterium]|nr:hypothetical protein [Candidatus Gracilibacteria bacterium]MDD3120696.1 hypothetical protein [Candidatus Gracilibacteria bacterium]MDD4530420.1 hypothetical protein [Candidatus Gracilibacteria bacterium]
MASSISINKIRTSNNISSKKSGKLGKKEGIDLVTKATIESFKSLENEGGLGNNIDCTSSDIRKEDLVAKKGEPGYIIDKGA